MDGVESLQQKLQLLDLNQMDALDARLTLLLQKLNQLHEKKKQLEGNDAAKVSAPC